MIDGKKVIAVIPARGGSKGVPRKNIRNVAGKPLIAWTIEEAKKSQYIDRLVLSSEDAEIIAVAKQFNCDVPFIRPKELAQDDTPGIEPVLHALQMLPGYDFVVLLQPTSPLRIVADIDGALEMCINRGVKACVAVTEPEHNPYWMFKMDSDGKLHLLIESVKTASRRQELPKVYAINGAVYVANCTWLQQNRSFLREETIGYEMPRERSLDIDHELDFKMCEMLLAERINS